MQSDSACAAIKRKKTREEFTLIFHSLRELVLSDHPIFAAAAQVQAQCRQIAFLFALGSAVVILGKIALLIPKNRTKKPASPV